MASLCFILTLLGTLNAVPTCRNLCGGSGGGGGGPAPVCPKGASCYRGSGYVISWYVDP